MSVSISRGSDPLSNNPYQVPAAVEHPDLPRRQGSIQPLVAVAIGCLLYHAFAILLLRSTPVDRMAGTLLLMNTPVILAWLVGAHRRTSYAYLIGFVASGMQCLILGIMLALDVGDWQASVLFSGLILVGWIIITAIGWFWRTTQDSRGDGSD